MPHSKRMLATPPDTVSAGQGLLRPTFQGVGALPRFPWAARGPHEVLSASLKTTASQNRRRNGLG